MSGPWSTSSRGPPSHPWRLVARVFQNEPGVEGTGVDFPEGVLALGATGSPAGGFRSSGRGRGVSAAK